MKTIQQKVLFRHCKAADLYSMYLNSEHHAKLTGGNPAHIEPKEGKKFSAHGGYCFGRNLQLVKDKLIVQTWRESGWRKGDIDSTFVLTFEQKGMDAVITMVHANIPDSRAKDIASGWKDFYWKPWKSYLAKLKRK